MLVSARTAPDDGWFSVREEAVLEHLRAHLGLTAEEAETLARSVAAPAT